MSQIRQRLFDQCNQSIISSINESHKLNFYRRYKKECRTEQYLDSIYESKYRISLSRFRLSSHNLSIETGRYNGVPKEERLCNFCNMRKMEDEFHFLLVCPLYTELRRKYFKNYFCNWPTLNKFDQLMLSSSKKTLGTLASLFILHLENETLRELYDLICTCNICYTMYFAFDVMHYCFSAKCCITYTHSCVCYG